MAAVALMCLVAFSAIVVDYGVLWAARGQAQSSADAGALAGALAIGAGETTTVSRSTASVVARQTSVWGETTAAGDVVVSNLPYPCPASAGGGNSCIRVDVLRGTLDDAMVQHTNTLPVFFAAMLGVTDQGVRATATAQAAQGNSINCIKPWAVADKSIDTSGPTSWDQEDIWQPAAGDVYRAPLKPETNPTGFSLANDRGIQLALKAGNVGTWSAGWTQEIDFPGHTGSDEYEEAIRSCPSWIPTVGLWAGQPCNNAGDADPARGCLSSKTGMSQGPTTSGVAARQLPFAVAERGQRTLLAARPERHRGPYRQAADAGPAGRGLGELGGERRYAMRIWLDPARMAAHRVDALDVQRAIRESNLQLPAGELEAEARKFTIDANARLDDPRAYEEIALRKENGRLVRIGDVGWAELGSENYQYITRYSARPIIGVGVARQSRANELEVARAVRAALPEVRKALPQDVDLFVSLDRALFVEASLAEARVSLWQALLAVLAVNLLFLRSLRSPPRSPPWRFRSRCWAPVPRCGRWDSRSTCSRCSRWCSRSACW